MAWVEKRSYFRTKGKEPTKRGASAPPVPRARGVPPLDSGLRNGLDGKTQLFSHETCENEKLKKRAIIIHGPTENKNGTGENSFSPLPFFRISGKHVVRKVSIIPQLGPVSMTLVFPDADIILAFHWHFNGLEPIRNIQYDFLGRGCGGNRSQEQTQRVCDAATAINANEESMRKQRAGHAMNLLRMVSPA